VLTFGLAMTGAMWAVGYVGHLPGMTWPSWAVAIVLLLVLCAGGYLTGRLTRRGGLGGFAAGLVAAMLNLLVLGGVLNQPRPDGSPAPSALLWIPGTLLGTALLCAVAAAFGARRRRLDPDADWTARLAVVAVAITGLLLIAGGLVTGREAGLAVPDWPSSYGYNMLLYPLARMTGNIYYEHAHRLYGMLVGLTTIILAIHLWRHDARPIVRRLALAAVLLVIAQGVLGGVRVVQSAPALANQAVEVASTQHDTALSAATRVIHGVTAQLFLALMAALAVLCSKAWSQPAVQSASAPTDRSLSIMLVATLTVQLILGALARHLHQQVMTHMTFAAVVLMVALAAALRAWGLHGEKSPALARCGKAVAVLVMLQVVLGVAALVVVGIGRDQAVPTPSDVLFTTAHQANGAALLACSVALMLLNHRLLAPLPRTAPA
jgi:cytochrome c oxidase assembly protein subunit 15